MSQSVPLAVLGLAVALLLPSTLPAESLPIGEPEALGFSPERLATMEASLERFVENGQHSGIVWLVARRGEIASVGAHGLRDREAGLPMEADTIVRIYSMSKIVTSVAALILFEEGRFDLGDPVSRYLPELGTPQVMVGGTADAPLLTTARSPITVDHLFTHTAGFYYDFSVGPELATLVERAELFTAPSLEEFTKRASTLPLRHHPGEAWTYGISTSLLGRLIEVLSGQRLGDFLQERIFGPLRMTDTGFSVPPEKRGRLATIYQTKEGRLTELELSKDQPSPEKARGLELGGAGLFSTIGDYARFAQMLLDGGVLDGQRILGRKTVEFMTVNRLAHLTESHIDDRAEGFGLGVAVMIDVGQSSTPASLGRYGWSGIATTDCQIDPREEIVALVFTQHYPFNEHRLLERFTTGYTQALVD
jgi:CubicO group peptidase (beta-lactamase class C family)